MKRIIVILFFLLPTILVFSQSGPLSKKIDLNNFVWSYAQSSKVRNAKLPIDFTAIDNWQQMSPYLAVSNNGHYFAYGIECVGGSPVSRKRQDSIIVQATDGSGWRFTFAGANWQPGFFAANNKYILQRKDSLYFLNLGSNKCESGNNVRSFKTSGKTNEWIAYQLKTAGSPIILLNLLTEQKIQFENIKSYVFDKSKKWLVCETNQFDKQLLIYNLQTGREETFASVKSWLFSPAGNKLIVNTGTEIQYNNFTNQTTQTIYTFHDTSDEVSDLQFDEAEQQVIFMIKNNTNKSLVNSIWYYKEGMTGAITKVNPQGLGLVPGQTIASASFSDSGNYIQVGLLQEPAPPQKASPGDVQLDVWSYKDQQRQTSQANALQQNKTYDAVVGIEDGRVKWLGTDGEQLSLLKGDYAIIKRNNQENAGDRFWESSNEDNKSTTWLITLKDGRRTLLPLFYNYYWFSPGGNYLVYFDPKQAYNYFSYEFRTGKTINISAGIQAILNGLLFNSLRTDKEDERPYGPAAWLENDKGLLVYDSRDVWHLDLSGQKSPTILTNGFGLKNDNILRLFNDEKNGDQLPVLKRKESLLLIAYQATNKTYGFYRTKTDTAAEPELLSRGAWFINMNAYRQLNIPANGQSPVKALHTETWIVQRQSVADAPNYYATKDFKSFNRLTNLQPQQGHKWLTEELHTYRHLDGKTGQGILYKPADFDPSKKYPVMIVFYNNFSNNMHQFTTPSYNYHAITPGLSPVWFTNNDYLVFTPDMNTTPLKVGQEAFNVIEGAAKYLKNLPYVDAGGLGCASHSWSAKLGAYIFTHSKSFSATTISEGFLYANMTNVALSGGDLEDVENGFHFGNLYENKASWLDHTTVLNVDKAISPLLLYCGNYEKGHEYVNQTLQFYTSLRRQDKKVWWLKYDKGSHNLYDLNEQKDYTVRYTQYFDHYLKKAPAPRWMTQGVPYAVRGVETRFELDAAGSCGLKDNCVICHAWNKQYKRNAAMFEKPIGEWSLDKDIQMELNNKIAAERKKLDAAGAIETKRILDILKNGYKGDKKANNKTK